MAVSLIRQCIEHGFDQVVDIRPIGMASASEPVSSLCLPARKHLPAEYHPHPLGERWSVHSDQTGSQDGEVGVSELFDFQPAPVLGFGLDTNDRGLAVDRDPADGQ